MARIPCRKCAEVQYDFETGEIQTYEAGATGQKLPMVRSPGEKLPCQTKQGCPKESPEKAHEHELSERNWRTLELWRRVRATHGACLSEAERRDAIVQRNLAIIDGIYSTWERQRQSEALGAQVASLLLPLIRRT